MRNISLYIILALAAAALASCTKAPSPASGGFPEDGIVRISTTVSALETKTPETRADAAPYSGSTLGLFLDYGNGEKYSQNNYLWENDGSNNWSAAAPMLWKDASTKLDVYAYAPYVAGEGSPSEVKFTIPLDQSEGLDAADLLWCPMQGFDPATGLTDKKLNIEFKHALVKLTVNIILGTEFKGKDISIREALFRGSVDKAAIFFRDKPSVVGVAPSVSANAVSIKMHDCSADGKLACEVIFYPHSFDGKEMLTFTLSDGKDYRLTPASGFDDRFKLGNAYNMNVKVGNDKVEIVNVAIADWDGSSNVGGENTDFEASKSPMPVDISDLRSQLSKWNTENPSSPKSLADMITTELLDESLSDGGELVVSGEFDNSGADSDPDSWCGMSEATLDAFARIAEYVRSGKVKKLDISGLKGIKGLSSASMTSLGTCKKNCSFYGSKLETFIGSPEIVALYWTFRSCDQLTSVSRLENVTTVEGEAFAWCPKLESLPDMPLVMSFKDVFTGSGITELRHKNVKELSFTWNCPVLRVIDCPSANNLSGEWKMPKLEKLYLESEYFERFESGVFNNLDKSKIGLYLNANQEGNVDEASELWHPKKNSAGDTPDGYNSPIKLNDFAIVYFGGK